MQPTVKQLSKQVRPSIVFVAVAVAFLGSCIWAWEIERLRGKGYLTLDPRKYTDGVRSVVIPLVFLLVGGFGLPGGAVYVQTNLIRSERWQSVMSLAGPAANLVFGSLCAVPFLFVGFPASHLVFFSALAFLAALKCCGDTELVADSRIGRIRSVAALPLSISTNPGSPNRSVFNLRVVYGDVSGARGERIPVVVG
jgi:hypothetical protein